MSITVDDLNKTVSLGLTTAIKKSKINFGQLIIEINVEDLYSTILYLKTNNKCRFKQLIDITAVDYPSKENRFKIVYFFPEFFNCFSLIALDCAYERIGFVSASSSMSFFTFSIPSKTT